jgi:hypothetical protein
VNASLYILPLVAASLAISLIIEYSKYIQLVV